jgi:CRISPR-associated protein Csm1
MCAGFVDLSSQLADARVLIEQPVDRAVEGVRDWRAVLAALGRSYTFAKSAASSADSWLLNDTQMGSDFRGFRFLTTALPQGRDGTATLEELAEQADGIPRWGILRADVDELGKAFRDGLSEKERSISRLSMLSYLLSYFFSARVPAIVGHEEFRDKVYLAYSGGDDLFAVGAWSVLPDLAQKLSDDFNRFASGRLTLSAGIEIAPTAMFPVYEAADLAGSAVDAAKAAGRNRLAFLSRAVTWKEQTGIKSIKDRLVSLLTHPDGLPTSVLGVLSSAWEQNQQAKEDARKDGGQPLTPIWRLLYAFKRLKTRHEKLASDIQWIEDKVRAGDCDLHPYLDLIVRWAELEARTKEDVK